LATGLKRAEDPVLEGAALFFACAVTLGTRGLTSDAGLRRLLPLTVLGFFARAALACFFAFPFETFFLRAAMDRLKMVKEHETLMKRLRRGKLGASTIHARRRMGTWFPPWHRNARSAFLT
jgi:hypothetical protein